MTDHRSDGAPGTGGGTDISAAAWCGRLLGEVEGLSHPERMRHTALAIRDLGRAAAGSGLPDSGLPGVGLPGVGAVLAVLRGGGWYERGLALHLARACRHLETLELMARQEPDPRLRLRAVAAVARAGAAAEALLPLVGDTPSAVRRLLYRVVRGERLQEAAEVLLPEVLARHGEREAAMLLPACGAELVDGLLPRLADALPGWVPLAHRHPAAVLGYLAAEVSRLPQVLTHRWWLTRGTALAVAGAERPALLLDLLEAHGPVGQRLPSVLHPALGRLLAAEPRRTVGLLTSDQWQWLARQEPPTAGRRAAAVLSDSELAAVVPRPGVLDSRVRRILELLPESRREAVFDLVPFPPENAFPDSASEELDVLPKRRRATEARRLLAVQRARRSERGGRPGGMDVPVAEEVRVLARTGRSEGFAGIAAALHAPDAKLRGAARVGLLTCAVGEDDPAALAEALDLVIGAGRDQEPVYSTFVAELWEVPGRLLADAVVRQRLEKYTGLLLAAPDLSVVVCADLTQVGFAVLAHAGRVGGAEQEEARAWAVTHLQRVTRHAPEPFPFDGCWWMTDWDLPGEPGRVLVDGLVAAVEPVLRAEADREECEVLVELVQELGPAAGQHPVLRGLLERAALGEGDGDAVEAWLSEPAGRAERVGRLLDERPEAAGGDEVACGVVGSRLTRRLGELLAAAAEDDAELADGELVRHAHRWTPAQVDAYRQRLRALAEDTGATAPERGAAVRLIGALPGSTVDDLRRWLPAEGSGVDGVGDDGDGDDGPARTLLATRALEALRHCSRPAEALPVLLGRLGGAHADAVVAAAACARHLPTSEVVAAFAPVLRGDVPAKVTARKTAARVLGATVSGAGSGPGARESARSLVETWRSADLHPDVRAAVARAMLPQLDRPEVAEALDGAARLPERVLPLDLPERQRAWWAGQVAKRMRGSGEVAADSIWWAYWAPEIAELLADRVAGPGSADPLGERSQAANRLPHASRAAGRPDVLVGAVRRLLETADEGGAAGQAACVVLADLLGRMRGEEAEPVGTVLADRPEWLAARLPMYVGELAADPVRTLREVHALVRDRPLVAARAAKLIAAYASGGEGPGRSGASEAWEFSSRLVRVTVPIDPERVLDAALGSGLPVGTDQAAALLVLAALKGAAGGGAWPLRAAEAVRGMRRHPDPDVRAAALAVLGVR